jgi:Uma2 family endonuclease
MRLYDRHGIKEYWVVDVVNRRLHVFQLPSGASYSQTSSVEELGTMNISGLPGTSVNLSTLFGNG